ncbi:MAG: PAS domain S-box protein [Syntrophobacteraceae bacterium]|nr:PAS domain S-box protein [Syntrophobacteraceae bacterium]
MRITDTFSFRALNSMVFNKSRPLWLCYLAALLFAVAAAVIRWQFLDVLEFRVLFVTFYPAVAVAALYGGFGPGLLATVVSAALADYFWVMPFHQLALVEFADGISLAVFIFSGGLISYLAEAVFRAKARATLKAEEEQKIAAECQVSAIALRESEERLRLFIEHAPAALAMFDLQMRFISCSRRWLVDLGLGDRDLRGISLYEVFPEIPERWKEVHRRAMAGEVLRSEADLFTRSDGTFQWFRWEVRPWHDSCRHIAGIVIFSEDITEIKKQKSELHSLNRTLRALSDTIRATIQASDVSELVNAVCRIIADVCGYPMVWIGFAEKDADKTVRFVARAGLDEDYLKSIKITWSDTELGRGPAGTAIRTGRPFVCRNISTDPHMRPWREQVMRQGFASSVSLPLNAGGTTLGVLTLYSREPDFFLEDEVKLLVELADNLAFGINGLRVRLAHQAAESGLRESRARLDLALRSAGMGTWHWDITANTVCFDQQARELLGMDQASVINTKDEVFTAIHPDDRQTVQEALARTLKENVPFHAEHRAVRPDGKVIHIAARGKVTRDARGRAEKLNGVLWDITERKHMENELRRSRDQLELRVEERTADLKSANEKLRRVPSMLIEAQESERQRLAMELHDSVGQTIAALKYRIEHVMACMEKEKCPKALLLLHEFVPVLQRSLDETRAIYMGLKPTILAEHGILATLEWYRRELLELYPQQHIELETKIEEADIPEDLKIAIFRIAQEALNNSFKHGRPEWVDVRLASNGGAIDLEISDDGIGMDIDYITGSPAAKSLGLIGMRERTELTGGEFSIKSIPNEGTMVKAVWRIQR